MQINGNANTAETKTSLYSFLTVTYVHSKFQRTSELYF